jgi:hypothetical protein
MDAIRWPHAAGAAVGALATLVALAYAWVAIFSHWIHPGESFEYYQRYAQTASPWVSVFASAPVYFALGRWLGRSTALAAWALHGGVSVAITALAGRLGDLAAIESLALAVRLAAVWLATRGERTPAAAVPR